MAYKLQQKNEWRAFKVGIFLFLRVTFLSFNHHFFLQFTGLEKTKEGDVPQNDCEKVGAAGPKAGNVIVCFVN